MNLGNAYQKQSKGHIKYINPDDMEVYFKYRNEALVLKCAIHELLGHGTGKLLIKDLETGKFNFNFNEVRNPFTNEKLTTWYNSDETWQSKFKKLSSGYEECRADSVALYLAFYSNPFQIFFPGREEEWDDIRYVLLLDIIKEGLTGLSLYDTKSKEFTQAHTMARHAIMRVVYEAQNVFTVDFFENDYEK